LGLKRAKGHRRKRASAQARVRKLPDHGPWNKYHGSLTVGLDQDKCFRGMRHMERYLVW
jgi:hypothetical protein